MADKRVAIVTGASKGIGRAIAEKLAADGRHVVLLARSEDLLVEVRRGIEERGGEASLAAVNVGDAEALAGVIEATADELGRLDILVNNAGITRDGLLLRMSNDDFDDVINVNLRSAFIACRAAARPMMRGEVRPDCEYRLDLRHRGQRRPGELRGEQGGLGWPDQVGGARAWGAKGLRRMCWRPASWKQT